jgi:hypothetical protein
LEILRNRIKEEELLGIIGQNFFEKERSGIHLSDLLYPRQAYWQKMHPLPPTSSEIQYWVIGRGHEDVVHRVSGFKHIESRVWNGIHYGIDFFREHPIEMKTRRGYLAKEGEEATRYDSYIAQLLGYCACENIPKGELWVWSLLEKKDSFRSAPEFAVYEVDFTVDELHEERERLMEMKVCLLNALSGSVESYDRLPECPEWKCIQKDTTVAVPPKCLTCNREFQTDWGIEKHIGSKTGKGHNVIYALYEVKITPRCKWYDECKGAKNVQAGTDASIQESA